MRYYIYFLIMAIAMSARAQDKWYSSTITNEGEYKHTFENSAITYNYRHFPGQTKCNFGTKFYGTAIENIIIKSRNVDVAGFIDGCGTGYNLCDHTPPVVSGFADKGDYIEYKVTMKKREKIERLYKDLPFIEMEYIKNGCLWGDDGFETPGASPSWVQYGAKDIDGQAAGKALWKAADSKCGHNYGNCFMEANGTSFQNCNYKNFFIYGLIDKATGNGLGCVLPYSAVDKNWKVWWDRSNLVNLEFFKQEGVVGKKRWFYAVTKGKDELINIGKIIADNGEIKPGLFKDKVSTRLTKENIMQSADISVRGNNIYLPANQLSHASAVNIYSICGRHIKHIQINPAVSEISIANLSAGIYVARLVGANMQAKFKKN